MADEEPLICPKQCWPLMGGSGDAKIRIAYDDDNDDLRCQLIKPVKVFFWAKYLRRKKIESIVLV